MADGEVLALRQDMTIARADFLRLLPAAVGDAAFELRGSEASGADGGRHWRVVVTPLPDLALGPIRLPRHRVEIHLAGYDRAATRAFLDRFELNFRRAGG